MLEFAVVEASNERTARIRCATFFAISDWHNWYHRQAFRLKGLLCEHCFLFLLHQASLLASNSWETEVSIIHSMELSACKLNHHPALISWFMRKLYWQ